ncbi:MAG: TolC family protein, partial [Gammaproteobacteria bacterium]
LPDLSLSLTGSGSDNPLNVLGMKLQQQGATFNDFGAGQFLQGIQQNNPAVVYDAPANLNDPGWYSNYQTKLAVTIPIYNGGQVRGGLHEAEAMLAAARRGESMARQQLLFQVVRQYEGVGAAHAYVKVANQGIDAAQSYVDLTARLFKRGVVAKTDVLQAKVRQGDARLALAKATKQLALNREALRILTGWPDNRALDLASDTMRIDLPRDSNVTQLQAEAASTNPGLQALGSKVQAAQAGVTQARAGYLPHFNVMMAREWNDRSVSLAHPSYTVAGVLTWNLFDFGSRGGALDRAQAKVIQRQAELRQARDKLRLQVEEARQDVHLAATRIEVKQAAVHEAAEAARLAKLRYAQGISTFTELLGAQTELDKARADLVAARYQDIMARAGLLLAMGRLEPTAIHSAATDSQP